MVKRKTDATSINIITPAIQPISPYFTDLALTGAHLYKRI
jgi:hypothetical protein